MENAHYQKKKIQKKIKAKKCKNIKKPKKLEKPIVQDNEHKQLNILSPQQVAKLKKNSSDKIPYITSKKKLY